MGVSENFSLRTHRKNLRNSTLFIVTVELAVTHTVTSHPETVALQGMAAVSVTGGI